MRSLVVKMSKVQGGSDRNMDSFMEISVAYGQPPLLYSENWYGPQQQHTSPLCSLALLHIANTCQPVASKLSYKHAIL